MLFKSFKLKSFRRRKIVSKLSIFGDLSINGNFILWSRGVLGACFTN